MDEKKVREAIITIENIDEASSHIVEGDCDINTALDTAIEALEKQLSKKVDEDECTEKTHCKCPTCGRILLTVYADGYQLGTMPKYCEVCGQMLDWSE